EEEIGLSRLNVVGAVHLPRHVAGERQDRRVIAARLVQARHEMRAAGAGGASAYRKLASKFGLAGGRESRTFLVAHAYPFNVAAANSIGEWIERVANQAEN